MKGSEFLIKKQKFVSPQYSYETILKTHSMENSKNRHFIFLLLKEKRW